MALTAPTRTGAIAALLPDGRLHLQHGPIDVVAEAFGPATAVRAAHARAAGRFASILDELVAELDALRSPDAPVTGIVARRMAAAVAPYRPAFLTPMAAVAGAVAEEVLEALTGPGITRAYANNGGDIAIRHVPAGAASAAGAPSAVTVGVVDRVDQPALAGRLHVGADSGIGGVATSGVGGRSLV